MTGAPDDTSGGFVDLSRLDRVKPVTVHGRGNISRDVESGPAAEAPAPVPHVPEVIFHREGDEVRSIEFVCTCGQRATVRIAYDDE